LGPRVQSISCRQETAQFNPAELSLLAIVPLSEIGYAHAHARHAPFANLSATLRCDTRSGGQDWPQATA
jgi:hypothetical protein